MGHGKGQYFSFDALVASVIFIMAFTAILSYWFSLKSSLDSNDDQISREAARISDNLMAGADKRISRAYFTSLALKSEDELKAQFNSPYSISITVNQSGTIIPIGPTSFSAVDVAKVRRVFVMYDASNKTLPAYFDLYLYR